MRIAFVHEDWGAGASRCVRDLESGLRERHEITCFPQSKSESQHSLFNGLADFAPDVVSCHSFFGSFPYDSLADISARYATTFTVHDPRPIGDAEIACWTCSRNSWCLRCPLIDSRLDKLFSNKYFRRRINKRRTHNRCAADLTVITPSTWIGNRLREQELKRFRIVHIPNGVDLGRFRPTSGGRAQFGLPQGATILLHSAWHGVDWAVNERKGLPYLAEAFTEHIAPAFPNAYLAVAGEYFAPNHPRVIPLGMVSGNDLPALLNSVDIYVTPTLADNFPYTVIEAMACGKPVIATDVGGISEQIDHEHSGLLVPPGDSEALGRAIARLLATPNLQTSYGAAGKEKTEKTYSMNIFLNAYESLLLEMPRLNRRAMNNPLPITAFSQS